MEKDRIVRVSAEFDDRLWTFLHFFGISLDASSRSTIIPQRWGLALNGKRFFNIARKNANRQGVDKPIKR